MLLVPFSFTLEEYFIMTLINCSQTLVDIHTYGVSSQRRRVKHEACFQRLFPGLLAEIKIPQSDFIYDTTQKYKFIFEFFYSRFFVLSKLGSHKRVESTESDFIVEIYP